MSAPIPRLFSTAATAVTAVAIGLFVVGCDAPQPPSETSPAAADDHDHGDHDHDHAEHDHADHDHDHAEHDHDHGDHDHGDHEHPETLAESVAVLKGLVEKVKSTLGGDDTSEADGHVHAIGNLLVDMEGKAEGLEDEVRGAVGELLDAFDELDQKIHEDAGPVFDDIAERVDGAITTLDTYLAELEKAAGEAVTDGAPGDGESSDAADNEADGS